MCTLVTGATGLVGNNVTRLLLEQGRQVRVMVRESSDPRGLEGLNVQRVVGDVRDGDAVRQACRGAAQVIHAAAHVHIGWSGLDLQRAINVQGTGHVAQAAREEGIRMVHVSSVDALAVGSPSQPATEDLEPGGKTPCSYVVTKREAEQVVLDVVGAGLDAVIVNPGFMLGPWDWKPSSGRMLLEVARRFTPLAPTGGCSVCDVRDVVAGILAALEGGTTGQRYILGGYNETYFDLWKLFARVTGGRPPWGRAGRAGQVLAGRAGDLVGWLTGREPDVNSASVAMSRLFHYYSSARAERDLGYCNRPLEESVEDAWRWFQTHGYVG